MTKTTGQFIEETKKILDEGISLIGKVQEAKSAGSFLVDANRDAANSDLKKLLQDASKEFNEAQAVLKQGTSLEPGRNGLFSPSSSKDQDEQISSAKSVKHM